MDIGSVCLLGGSGFVGRAIADHATAKGIRIRVLSRSLPRARHLTVLPTVELMQGDPHDEATLARAFEGMDAVVNLVGVLHESRREPFTRVHAEIPRKAALACRANGVQHFMQVSALGASERAPSRYLRSKAAGEAAVRLSAGELAWTVLRPSVIFGEDDRFLNLFADLVKLFPVVPLAAAHARFQPVWVEDVARCCIAALGSPLAFGQAYDLCGPRIYTLRELVAFIEDTLDVHRWVVPLPAPVAELQATILGMLPGRLLTRDNLRSMSVDSICSGRAPPFCAFEPSSIEAVVPAYMGPESIGTRYARYRSER